MEKNTEKLTFEWEGGQPPGTLGKHVVIAYCDVLGAGARAFLGLATSGAKGVSSLRPSVGTYTVEYQRDGGCEGEGGQSLFAGKLHPFTVVDVEKGISLLLINTVLPVRERGAVVFALLEFILRYSLAEAAVFVSVLGSTDLLRDGLKLNPAGLYRRSNEDAPSVDSSSGELLCESVRIHDDILAYFTSALFHARLCKGEVWMVHGKRRTNTVPDDEQLQKAEMLAGIVTTICGSLTFSHDHSDNVVVRHTTMEDEAFHQALMYS